MASAKPIRICVLSVLLLLGAPGQALALDPPGYTAPYEETLATVNFPLIALFGALPEWASDLVEHETLAHLSAVRRTRASDAAGCSSMPGCLAEAWIWTEDDIAVVDDALRTIALQPERVRVLVTDHMRPSGRFGRYAALEDVELLAAAWADTAAGLNNVMRVYAMGIAPRYPLIDSMIFDPVDRVFMAGLNAHSEVTLAMSEDGELIFGPSIRFVSGLLRMNERTDAARHRPLSAGENAAASRAAKSVAWGDYPYPAMLVFGHGPEDKQSRTGPMSYIRMEWAAQLFARQLAPFIIVSGGNVHPDRTPFNEALEMKRILVEHHDVPAERVIIEPHARHTTTNLRNSARLLFGLDFPTDRPSLVVTDPITAQYIGSSRLIERAVDETGINPGRVSSSSVPFAFEFHPDMAAFHVESLDPLDP